MRGVPFSNLTAETLRARSLARSAREADARSAAAGLVPVSTTCTNVQGAFFGASDVITIDRDKARVTRLRKSLGVAAKALHNAGPDDQQVWMQTLTYAGDNRAWRPEHISRYLDGLRRWHYARTGSKTVRYAWVAELQQRGVIHYHVVIWLAGGLTPPKPDRSWRRKDRRGLVHIEPPMWPHGMSNRLKARAPVAYLMKYASKVESKNVGGFPHGARIHGCGGLDAAGRACRRWVTWPAYVQGNASVCQRYRPAPGGGYVDHETGELLRSDFAPTGGGFRSFVRVRHTPTRIARHELAGPYSWLSDRPGHAA